MPTRSAFDMLAELEWLREFVRYAGGHPVLTPWQHRFVGDIRKNYVETGYTKRVSKKQFKVIQEIAAKIEVDPSAAWDDWLTGTGIAAPGEMEEGDDA